MEGIYPLLLDGTQAGELRVSVQGGWTVFEAQCSPQPGVVRVSVYGEDGEGYLGVLAPEGEGLTLRRKLSRSDLRGFPAVIQYAGRAGEPQMPKETPPETIEAPAGCDAPGAPEPESTPAGRDAHIAPSVEPPPEAEAQNEAPPDAADLYWYATTDGALTAFDGEQNLLALPLGDDRISTEGCGEPRSIDGWDYVVFRKKP